MPAQVTISSLTGASPYELYVCDTTLSSCTYVVTFAYPPYVFNLPSPYDTEDFCIKIVDNNGCWIVSCKTPSGTPVYITPTPTKSVTPTNTPTPTTTPTPSNTEGLTPTPTETPSTTPTNTSTPSETPTQTPTPNPPYYSATLNTGVTANDVCSGGTPTTFYSSSPIPTVGQQLFSDSGLTNLIISVPFYLNDGGTVWLYDWPIGYLSPQMFLDSTCPTPTPTPTITQTSTITPTPSITSTNTPTTTNTPTPSSTTTYYLLQEDGFYVLQEDGSKIIIT